MRSPLDRIGPTFSPVLVGDGELSEDHGSGRPFFGGGRSFAGGGGCVADPPTDEPPDAPSPGKGTEVRIGGKGARASTGAPEGGGFGARDGHGVGERDGAPEGCAVDQGDGGRAGGSRIPKLSSTWLAPPSRIVKQMVLPFETLPPDPSIEGKTSLLRTVVEATYPPGIWRTTR